MSLKLRAAITALLLAPQAVYALGLGDIRLGSALNEPLSAEIELVAPTSDELSSLSAQLASRELFQRYGLDRPAYLDSVQFNVGRGRDGRNVLLVNSDAPISEPFVTFLVEVNWPRGRLLREYTVLLDPPVFAPREVAPPAPVAAPRTAQRAVVPSPAPAQSLPEPATPSTAGGASDMPSSYRVQPGDTLYGVASQFTGGDRTQKNRMMIAMFRANPEAFGGNINLLKSGTILRIPGPDAVAAIGAGEAASEIGRQTAAWRNEEVTQEPARLRLVTPTEVSPQAGSVEPVATDPEARISQLNREIEESQRLLELKNAELARLQQQRAEDAAAVEAAGEAAPEGATQEPAAEVAEPLPEPAAPETAPAAVEKAPEPVVEERSFIDRLTDSWQYVLGAAALLLGGGLAYGYMRRRREEDLDDAIRSFESPVAAPRPSDTQRIRALSGGAVVGTTTEDQEFADFHTATLPPSGRTAKDLGATFEETLSTEEPADLDQGDPLAEADFHMAYGLYDQAADIVKLALDKEPARRDLKVKLLEIFFVSGDKARFIETAQEFSDSRTDGDTGDWDRILIMGRQLAPDHDLFESAAQSVGVDLNLEGGDSHVDLELLAPPDGEDGIDLDLGEALGAGDGEADTGEREALDFDLDITDQGGSETQVTRIAEFPAGDEPTVESTGLQAASGDSTAEMPTLRVPVGDEPTMESTRLQPVSTDSTAELPTLRVKLGDDPSMEATRLAPVSGDTTAEMPMDDLGIDLSALDDLPEVNPEDDVTQMVPIDDSGLQPSLGDKGMDFDLSELSSEVAVAGTADETQRVDMDVGGSMADQAAEFTATEQISLEDLPQMPELEPVTMSEVGTKLDLARAYVDMGDPDGARSILEEVLKEGSASQMQEAQRLLDSLPGA